VTLITRQTCIPADDWGLGQNKDSENRMFSRPNFVLARFTLAVLFFASSLPASAGRAWAKTDVAEKIAQFKEDDDVASLEFSPDGRAIAVGTFVTLQIHLWQWQGSPRIKQTFSKPPVVLDYTPGDGIRYSPDGRFLAVSHGLAKEADGRGVVRVFDAQKGVVLREIADPLGGGLYSRIAFTPDGKFLVRSYDSDKPSGRNQFIVLSTDTWNEIWGLRTMPLNVISLALSADGKLAALGGITLGPGVVHNALILIVDLGEKRVVRTIDNAFAPENRVERVAWNPDGIHLAAGGIVGGTYSGPDAVRIYDVSTGALVATEKASSAHISALRYTPDGKYLIESGIGKSIRIWDASHQNLLQELPDRHAYAITVSRDSAYLATGDGANVEIWKLQ
jgi:WD40 repeat protein